MSDELAAKVEQTPAGTKRAFFGMTGEWQQPGARTFNWAGAEQASKRFPELIERELQRLGKQHHSRMSYRLNNLGMEVAAALRARSARGEGKT